MWSKEKFEAINASMLPEEKMIEYVFPILRFHSRWSELSNQDYKYLFHKDRVSNNGYLMNTDIRAAGKMPRPRPLRKYKFSDNVYSYLDKMVKLCRENGAELVLIKAPVLYPYWYKQWDKQIVKYAKENKLTYINFLESVEDAGLDFNKDTYDKGLHLNVYGAEKLSRYFGKFLRDDLGLIDKRSDKELSEIWKDKIMSYDIEKKKREEKRGD